MDTIHLNIAEVGLAIQSDNPEFLAQVADRYEGFVVPTSDGFTMTVDTYRDISTVGEDLPRVTSTSGGFKYERRDFRMNVDTANKSMEGSCAPNMFSFDSCLRVFFTAYLLDLGGVLVHGAGVVSHDRSFLFFGVSGSGKTTTARLSAPRKVLSDELTIIRRVGDGIRAFGTPFWGELQKNGENINAPLAGLNLLLKDTEAFLKPMSPRDALTALLPCVLFFSQDPKLVNRVLNIVADITATTPAHAMHFLPDNTFWRLFEND